METNLPEGFTVFRFARSTWRRIRTNNGLENLNRQIRRRTRVVGIFPNTESALRLITAVVEEIHEDWLTLLGECVKRSEGPPLRKSQTFCTYILDAP